jgi:Cu-processing system ATP-binding protein
LKNNVIEVSAVAKRFGEIRAVDGVDLAVQQGEIFGLIGHNGAGKSTLFKMMLGLLPASEGEIRIHGQSIEGEAFRQVRRHIGYLPENVVFYDNLTGLETLGFFADLKSVDKSTCPVLLEKVGLGHAAKRRVRGYSRACASGWGLLRRCLASQPFCFWMNLLPASTRKVSGSFTKFCGKCASRVQQ